MNLISWNVRGLNGPRKYRMIKNLIQKEKPHLLFLQETKCNSQTLGSILTKAWPGSRSVAVDAVGSSGGLAIAWNPQALQIGNFHASHNLIQATFHPIGTNIHGHLSNVYFPQDLASKVALLNTLEHLNSNRTHPIWILGGDFNMITRLAEKSGGRARLDQDSAHFKDFISNKWLMDVPFCNGLFTWSNRRTGRQQIASKLDRFLLSDNAIHVGGDITGTILPIPGSDHWPIILQWQSIGFHLKKPFRFEAFWLSHPTFSDLVHSV